MNRPSIKLAMDRVDAAEYDGHSMLAASEALHQAEIAAIHPDAQAMAAEQARADAEKAANAERLFASREAARQEWMKAEALADALVAIARAKARAGHDLTVWSPAEAQHVLNAYGLFSDAQAAPAPELPHSFKAESDPAAIARGAAVGAIIGERQ